MGAYEDIFGTPTPGLPDDFFGGGNGPGAPDYSGWDMSLPNYSDPWANATPPSITLGPQAGGMSPWDASGELYDPGNWFTNFLKGLKFNAGDAGNLLGAAGSLLGGGGGSPMSSEEQKALQQQMLSLLQQQQGYMRQMDPLREAVLKMGMGMLPVRYQNSGSFAMPGAAPSANVTGAAVPRSDPSSPEPGGGTPLPAIGGGGGGGYTPERPGRQREPNVWDAY